MERVLEETFGNGVFQYRTLFINSFQQISLQVPYFVCDIYKFEVKNINQFHIHSNTEFLTRVLSILKQPLVSCL